MIYHLDIDPIHGRDAELRDLLTDLDLAVAGQSRLVVMYGRRRVGKTFLVQHLLETAAHRPVGSTESLLIGYHAASRLPESEETALAWHSLQQGNDPPTTWTAFFDRVVELATQQPVLLALDEVPYLVEGAPAFPSILQRAWDRLRHRVEQTRLALILTGSALSTMTHLISSGGALFERPQRLLHLQPFDGPTSASFLKAPTASRAVEAFAACGGYPLLLSRWDATVSAKANLVRLAGDPVGALATNASILLLDAPPGSGHDRVLEGIGRGATRHNEIASRVGQRVERSLDLLQASGYVARRHPIGEPHSNHPIYELSDTYLRFWFAVLQRDLQLIEGGQGPAVITRNEPSWQRHLADTYERLCRQHTVRLVTSGVVPEMIVGEWWTDRPRQAQFDVVGLSVPAWGLVGEVKWSARFGYGELRKFRSQLDMPAIVDRARDALLVLWSRESFSPEVAAHAPEALLFTADDVMTAPSDPPLRP